MLTVLIEYIFAFSIGILIGYVIAYEVFQDQLKKGLIDFHIMEMMDEFKETTDVKDL